MVCDIEHIAASQWFQWIFRALLIITFIIVGVDVANILISILTAEIVLLTLGANRRSNLALHAKLDELLHAADKARDDLVHLEDQAEEVIRDKRL